MRSWVRSGWVQGSVLSLSVAFALSYLHVSVSNCANSRLQLHHINFAFHNFICSAESIFCLCFVTTIIMPSAKSKRLSLETTVAPKMAKGWIRKANRNLLRSIKGEALGQEQHYNMSEGDQDLSMELPNDLANLQALA